MLHITNIPYYSIWSLQNIYNEICEPTDYSIEHDFCIVTRLPLKIFRWWWTGIFWRHPLPPRRHIRLSLHGRGAAQEAQEAPSEVGKIQWRSSEAFLIETIIGSWPWRCRVQTRPASWPQKTSTISSTGQWPTGILLLRHHFLVQNRFWQSFQAVMLYWF